MFLFDTFNLLSPCKWFAWCHCVRGTECFLPNGVMIGINSPLLKMWMQMNRFIIVITIYLNEQLAALYEWCGKYTFHQAGNVQCRFKSTSKLFLIIIVIMTVSLNMVYYLTIVLNLDPDNLDYMIHFPFPLIFLRAIHISSLPLENKIQY